MMTMVRIMKKVKSLVPTHTKNEYNIIIRNCYNYIALLMNQQSLDRKQEITVAIGERESADELLLLGYLC